MSLDSKFSNFADGGDLQINDIVVGLRNGINTRFNNNGFPGVYLLLAGGTMSGSINMDGNGIINLVAPTNASDATNKFYVDTEITNAIAAAISGLGTMASQNANAVAITGGTIDDTVIGGVTPAAATVTKLTTEFTATESDSEAVSLNCDAAGFSDVKAVEINYTSGALPANAESSALLINVNGIDAVNGEIAAIDVLGSPSAANLIALRTSATVAPIAQQAGTFANAASILNIAVDVTAALASGGAGNVSVFVADNDTVTIGSPATFFEIAFEIATTASGSGIAPTFEFSTGVGTWASFTPIDGTNGFRQSGLVEWNVSSTPAWAVGTGSNYLIRITRTRNTLVTTPILTEVQIAATTEYYWDNTGKVFLDTVAVGEADETNVTVNGATFVIDVGADTNSSADHYSYLASRHTATASLPAGMAFIRSRGTHAAPAVVQNGDAIGSIYFAGFDGTDYALGAQISASVSSTPGSNDMPCVLDLSASPDGAQSPLLCFRNISVASAVNYVAVQNNATGSSPFIDAQGTDTNIILTLRGKGTGGVQILGTSTNNDASTGYVGEIFSSVVLAAGAVAISPSGTTVNVTSITLTPGDWDIYGSAVTANSGTATTFGFMGISATSATLPDGAYQTQIGGSATAGTTFGGAVSPRRFTISSNTTYYLVCRAGFSGGTQSVFGNIYARRAR